MKKVLRCALTALLLAALCLGLSGCENEEDSIRQALIDMGYMNPTPKPSETPAASAMPEDVGTPDPGVTPDNAMPTPDLSNLPTPNLSTPQDIEAPAIDGSHESIESHASDNLPVPTQRPGPTGFTKSARSPRPTQRPRQTRPPKPARPPRPLGCLGQASFPNSQNRPNCKGVRCLEGGPRPCGTE